MRPTYLRTARNQLDSPEGSELETRLNTDSIDSLDLFQPHGGFPDGVRVEDGHITMPDLPGIGFEGKADLYKEMRALSA
jgi:hypothetical protein